MTPLMTASYQGQLDTLLSLITAGADLNAKNNNGRLGLRVGANPCLQSSWPPQS
jgi:ankyrin repeat protein